MINSSIVIAESRMKNWSNKVISFKRFCILPSIIFSLISFGLLPKSSFEASISFSLSTTSTGTLDKLTYYTEGHAATCMAIFFARS